MGIPQVDFYGAKVSRLILGDNPFNGHSYIAQVHPGSEMIDYHTADKCVETLFEAERNGIDTYMALGEPFVLRVIRQYRQEGGRMKLMFQSFPAMELETNLRMMLEYEPLAIYHQGTMVDYYTETEQVDLLRERLRIIKAAGVKVGIGTHVPETLIRSEEENWGVDFYMACLYNARRTQRGEQSGFITGKPKELVFYPDDRFLMLEAIRKVSKPCIAFKVLAGGQRIMNLPEAQAREEIKRAFKETYEGIKPGDMACVGVFQKYANQLREDTDIVKELLGDK